MENRKIATEFEQALLGLILSSKESFDKVKGLISAEDFYDEKNRIVFQAIDDISEQGYAIEPTPVLKLIAERKYLDKIGGSDYIDALILESGLESNVVKYAEAIVEKSRMRQVIDGIDVLQKDIKKKDYSADDILEKVEMDIISTTRGNALSGFQTSKEIVQEVIDEMALKLSGQMVSGIPTDYRKLDDITGGFHKGDLIILAARPSMGKTALALNLAANIAKTNSVAFFSIEMPSKAIVNRIIGFTGFLESHKLQQPKLMSQSDNNKFQLASEKVENLNLHIDDSPGIKLSELVWKAKRLQKNKGLDIIFIDYLQLISVGNSTGDNRQAEVSTISRTLKKLARELDVPVIALSQLSRKVEQRESKVPMMSDIRESGAIEQDADLIGFVYREAYYKSKDAEIDQSAHQETKLIIGKHRNGATGSVKFSFNPSYGLFMDHVKDDNE